MTRGAICLFGFGYTARAVAQRLAGDGWTIIATTRSAETAAEIARLGHTPVLADPANPDDRPRLCEAAAASCAWLSCAPPGEAGDPFLAALDGVSPRGDGWIGYLSTTGVYGDRQGGWAFEWEAPTPGQPRSVRRAAAEAAWAARGARLFRLAGIYGPGRSAFDRLADGRPVIDKPGHVFSRIHVDDIATAIVAALVRPDAVGPFNLADDWPDTQAAVMAGAAQIAGLPPPPIEPVDQAAMSPMQASFFAECRRVSNARAKSALGWRPAYPGWREGLAAIWEDRG